MKKNGSIFFYGAIFLTQLSGVTVYQVVQERCLEQLQDVIEQGFDVNEKDKEGKNALYYACQNDNVDILKCLYAAGAFLHTSQHNLLEIARASEKKDIIIFLIKQGIKLSQSMNNITSVLKNFSAIDTDIQYCIEHALLWKDYFKRGIAVEHFVHELQESKDFACASLGFVLAYNQGQISFFEKIHDVLYCHNERRVKCLNACKVFENIFFNDTPLHSKEQFQQCCIEKALKDKNNAFWSQALYRNWKHARVLIAEHVQHFFPFQKRLFEKVIFDKYMISHAEYDIKFLYSK